MHIETNSFVIEGKIRHTIATLAHLHDSHALQSILEHADRELQKSKFFQGAHLPSLTEQQRYMLERDALEGRPDGRIPPQIKDKL